MNILKLEKIADSAENCKILHIFMIFKRSYFSNGTSNDNKPIHILKVFVEDYQLKETALKNIHVEVNDVIFKMAEFATFTTKMQKIARTAYSILTIHTIFFNLKSRSI